MRKRDGVFSACKQDAEKTPSLFRMPSFSVFSNSLSLRGFRDDGVVSYVHVSHEKGIAYE